LIKSSRDHSFFMSEEDNNSIVDSFINKLNESMFKEDQDSIIDILKEIE
jgi:hypothetical protein